MTPFEPAVLSACYRVRRLTADDVDMVCRFCQADTQYAALCGQEITTDVIRHDMAALPPGIPPEQKYYVGFFDQGTLIALMDLIAGHPMAADAFIGFFMMDSTQQGRGLGSRIVSETLDVLRRCGYSRCMLAMDSVNPQARHFWQKNGFAVTREVPVEGGALLVAERPL